MELPKGFQFSQGGLQDYVECARRFQLRYLRRLRWPAVEANVELDSERYVREGAAFHQLVRQHVAGVGEKSLSASVTSPEMRRWWHGYLEDDLLKDLPELRYAEIGLSAPLVDSRLVARYDMIAVEPGARLVILDWKTNRRRPRRSWLSERMQTRVYPYVAVRAASALYGIDPVPSGNVEMIYWFANYPSRAEAFEYDEEARRADEGFLKGLIQEIEEEVEGCPEGALLPATRDKKRCSTCRYRSLCERGIEPGRGLEGEAELSDVLEGDIGFEQIGELRVG